MIVDYVIFGLCVVIFGALIGALGYAFCGQREPVIPASQTPRTCQSCKFVGYPVAGVIPNHGHCRRFAPATGLRGPDRWPIIELPATVCGDYQAGPLITLNVPDDEHP